MAEIPLDYRNEDLQADRKIDRQKNRQINKQIDRQIKGPIGMLTYRISGQVSIMFLFLSYKF